MRSACSKRPRTLTQAAYARHRRALKLPGGTRQAVRKAVKEGRIDLLPNRRIDPAAADRAWDERTIPKFEGESAPGTGAADARQASILLASVRSQREDVRRQLDQLRLFQATGEMVPRGPFLEAATTSARIVQERFLALARRLKDVMAATTDADECERILHGEFLQILAILSKPAELLAPAAPGITATVSLDPPPLAPLPPAVPQFRGRFGR